MRYVWLGFIVTVSIVHPALLSAQAGPARVAQEREATYRELIGKALEEYGLGHWSEARVYFADAHAIWPNARTLRGLGMTYYEARNYAEAIDHLEQALQNQVQPLSGKLAAEARGILAQAQRFAASVRIELVPAGAAATLDDKPLLVRPDGTTFVNPGDHQIEVNAEGYQDLHRTFSADAGQSLRLRLALTPIDDKSSAPPPLAAATAPETSLPEREQPLRLGLANQQPVAAAALAGAGVIALGVGWVFYALRDSVRLELWETALRTAAEGRISLDQAELSSYRLRGVVSLGSVGASMALFGLAQYFWLPEPEPGVSVPPWAWVVGAAGVAIGLTGVGFAIWQPYCEISDRYAYCRRTSSDRAFAPLIALHSLPFLTLPLTYLLRPRERSSSVALHWWGNGSDAFGLRVSGAF